MKGLPMLRPPIRYILLLALFLAASGISAQERKKDFTIEEVLRGFSSRGVRGFQWIERGKAYSCLEADTAQARNLAGRVGETNGVEPVAHCEDRGGRPIRVARPDPASPGRIGSLAP